MKRFIQGNDRAPDIALPAQWDDYVTKDNPSRVIDVVVVVDERDLATLGCASVSPADASYIPPSCEGSLRRTRQSNFQRVDRARALANMARRHAILGILFSKQVCLTGGRTIPINTTTFSEAHHILWVRQRRLAC
jgi:hypothetical protein